MGLLSDALRWINPPKRLEFCSAHHRFDSERPSIQLTCDLRCPHPGPHLDATHQLWWADDETGVDW